MRSVVFWRFDGLADIPKISEEMKVLVLFNILLVPSVILFMIDVIFTELEII